METRNPAKEPTPLKVVFFGPAEMGKTSVLNRLVKDIYNESYAATIGVDFEILDKDHKRANHKFQIWDTAGQSRFSSLTPTYYKNASVLVGFFDATKPDMSLRSLINMARTAAGSLGLKKGVSTMPLILVANKADDGLIRPLLQEAITPYGYTETPKTELEDMGFVIVGNPNTKDLDYIAVSAKQGAGIDNHFMDGLNAAAQRYYEMHPAPAPTVQPAAPVEPEKKAEYLKIIFFGPKNTGKTQTLNRLEKDAFKSEYIKGICPDFGFLNPAHAQESPNRYNQTDQKFQIWDTPGNERYHSMLPIYYKNPHAFVGFFDVTDASSIDKLYKMAEQAAQSAPKGTPLILVGNKADLLNGEESKVTRQKADEITLRLELMGFKVYTGRQKQGYVSISARDVTGFDEALVPMLNEAAQAAIQIKAEKLAPAAEPAPQAQNKPSESNTGLLDRFVMWVRTPKSSSNDPKPTSTPTQKK